MSDRFWEELQQTAGKEQCFRQENMSAHTTFKVGGPAEYFACPKRERIPAIVALCRRYEIPWHVIGNGSNLLVADEGISGLVIEIGRECAQVAVQGNVIKAQAGALLSVTAAKAAEHGLTGMEFASGFPQRGRSSSYECGRLRRRNETDCDRGYGFNGEGAEKALSLDELDFGYRHSSIPQLHGIVLDVEFTLCQGEMETIREQMAELRRKRSEKQPLEYPSAGSTFKRPEGYFAGKLIQDAGLRGYRVGDAQVSEKHCGFVINRGNATASQIHQLICDVQEKVKEQFGVDLKTEVRFLGNF